MKKVFLTGKFQNLPAQGREEEITALLRQGAEKEKPGQERICPPEALQRAFDGDGMVIAIYVMSKKIPQLVGWLQLTRIHPLFNPPMARIGMWWGEGSEIETNFLICLFRTAKILVHKQWAVDRIVGNIVDESQHGWDHTGLIIDDILLAGGRAARIPEMHKRWEIAILTEPECGDDLNRLPPRPPLLPNLLQDEFRWHRVSRVIHEKKISHKIP